MKKLFVFLLIICLVAFFSVKYQSKIFKKKVKKKKAFIYPKKGDLVFKISSTGKIISNRDVEIKCKASGEIIYLPFEVSNQVKKGELIAKLDPIDEERNVSLQKISLKSLESSLKKLNLNYELTEKKLAINKLKLISDIKTAKKNLDDKKVRLKRLQVLLKKNLSSQEEFDTAKINVINAENNLNKCKYELSLVKIQNEELDMLKQDISITECKINSQKVALSQANQRLTDTKIFSPISGIITSENVQIGQIISSGISNVGGGTTLMTISDLSKIYVIAYVDESDIGKVKIGQFVDINVDSFPKKHFKGKIIQIAAKGTNVSNVVTFEVKIIVKNDRKHILKPEMTANIDIIIDEKFDVIKLPLNSIYQKKRKSTVKIFNKYNKIEEVDVETGLSDGEFIEIVKGLSVKDKVFFDNSSSANIKSKWSRTDRMKNRMMRKMGRRK